MVDRIISNEFIFWVKATVGLQITKDGLCRVIEKKMPEFVEMLSNDQGDHLRTMFLPIKILTTGRVNIDEEGWKFQSKCTRCCSMFTNILENHTSKLDPSINWQCHHPSEQASTPVWWIIAKIFMPGNNISCMGPQEADILALFGLVMNCKLFSTLSTDTKEVIAVRKTLMFHPSNRLTEHEMRDAMNKMKTLLQQEMVLETSTMELNKIKKLEQEPTFFTKLSKENRKLVVQALQLKASSIEYDIKQQLSSGRSTEALELELQKTKDKMNDLYVDEIEKVDKMNAILREDYQRLQELYNDECAKRQQIEQETAKLRWKLADADQRLQCKEREFEESNEEFKQMKLLYKDECAKRQQLEKENAQLRKKLYSNECAKGLKLEKENVKLRRKLSDEDEKVQYKIEKIENLTQKIKQMKLNRDLTVSFKDNTMKNEVPGATAGGTVV